MDVDLEKRTKVSRACDYCKKRKFKCSGVAPCELCTKKGIECEFSIIDRRTIRRKNKKRTVRNKPSSSAITKNGKDDDLIDKKTLKMLTKKSKIPLQYEPLLTFPLHKLDNNSTKTTTENMNGESKTISSSGTTGNSVGTKPVESNGKQEEQSQVEDANDEAITKKIVMEEERDPPKVLYDSEGNLRYVGESSPLSFLFECRNIFLERLGPSKFTSETDCLEVIDEPDESMEILQVALPSKHLSDEIVKIFYTNIQQACYFFEAEYFVNNIINPVYTNYSECTPDKIALVNLVISLGLLFAEANNNPILKELQSPTMQSSAYFEFGFYLTKKHMSKGKLWITEAYSLAYCYYQAKQQRNAAWLMLGMAIRNAQALGLHRRYINESFKDRKYILHRRRLFRSLYLLDRITSILLGRPLIIDDYDWDDFDCEDIFDIGEDGKPLESFRFQCMIESCKISKLIGKVIRNFYLDGIINPYKAEKLAIELKLWSLNLPEELQIDKVFVKNSNPTRGSNDGADNKMPLMIMHLSQLYAIVLLCRPFFMYLIFKRKKKRKNILKRPKTRPEIAMCNFCKATAKASALIIQLVENYINSIQYLSARAELHGLTHTCFLAALIIGLSLLYLEDNGYTKEDGYTPQKQMGYLNSSNKIFEYYARSNPISLRFQNIISQMKLALMEKFNLDEEGNRINNPESKVEVSHGPTPAHTQQPQPQLQQEPQPQPAQQQHQQQQPSTQQPMPTKPGIFGEVNPDVPFNEDYDNFIDNFGNLLPMATMKQSMTNNIAYLMNARPYQDSETPEQAHLSVPQSVSNERQNHYQYLPTSDASSTNPSSSLSYNGQLHRGEPLDAFMHSVGLNDILYDAK